MPMEAYGAWPLLSTRSTTRSCLWLGNKGGMPMDRIYLGLIRVADKRFTEHLNRLDAKIREKNARNIERDSQ